MGGGVKRAGDLKAVGERGCPARRRRQLPSPQAEAPQVGEALGPFLSAPSVCQPLTHLPRTRASKLARAPQSEKSSVSNSLHCYVSFLGCQRSGPQPWGAGQLEVAYRVACRPPSMRRTWRGREGLGRLTGHLGWEAESLSSWEWPLQGGGPGWGGAGGSCRPTRGQLGWEWVVGHPQSHQASSVVSGAWSSGSGFFSSCSAKRNRKWKRRAVCRAALDTKQGW